jgi:hypothetical protein
MCLRKQAMQQQQQKQQQQQQQYGRKRGIGVCGVMP